MAIKKSDLYSKLWKSCDELRGGMDASQYKDYILILLFMRYVTDKYYGKRGSLIEVPEGGSFKDLSKLKGDKEIGDKINKVIRKMADENDLVGVITVADFNDSDKLGKGKEMVDRLTNLIAIFEDEELNFAGNGAQDDDILGDAYEYLMRNFATESGKSKGQFYTPAEVSRIMAKVIGINQAKNTDQTIYDPTCGSGSLLLKAADEAPVKVTIYGQEKDVATVALAKMNMILHGNEVAEIVQGDTITSPEFKNSDGGLKTFDFAVSNPPFSTKSWSNGLDAYNDLYDRFTGFGIPPAKNGDYAFLLHLTKSLKSQRGKGAIILPHGVLFRGNVEGEIREKIIRRGYIKGIIGLPANLFYGTGIPACIIVIDKENAEARKGIFMIDASKGFVKDGNKNRLREQDIRKIVDVFNNQLENQKYSRMVSLDDIEKNEYNLNITRYIDTQEKEDIQNIEAHLKGGIPNDDINQFQKYWNIYPSLKQELFSESKREDFSELTVAIEDIKPTIVGNREFRAFSGEVEKILNSWSEKHTPLLKAIDKGISPKTIINEMAESLLKAFENKTLIDKYDIYQYLMTYWLETMKDDVYMIEEYGWIGNEELIPKDIVINKYFKDEKVAIDQVENERDEIIRHKEELEEENSGEEDVLNSVSNKTEVQNAINEYALLAWKEYESDTYHRYQALNEEINNLSSLQEQLQEDGFIQNLKNDKGNITKTIINKRLKTISDESSEEYMLLKKYVLCIESASNLKKDAKNLKGKFDEKLNGKIQRNLQEEFIHEIIILNTYMKLINEESNLNKRIKDAKKELDSKVMDKYKELTVDEIKSLVVDDKWMSSILSELNEEVGRVSQRITVRVIELAERYVETLPQIENEVNDYEDKVKAHLERMGFVW